MCWGNFFEQNKWVVINVLGSAKHVKEACRLLNKSIIRVEQPDIHLEEEEEDTPLENMEGMLS